MSSVRRLRDRWRVFVVVPSCRLRWLCAASALALACRAPLSETRLDRARKAVLAAREVGAYRCAARELALAQAHLEFAQVEAIHGNVVRARVHLRESGLNAAAARRVSLAAGCRPAAVRPANGQRDEPRDRDGDGVLDQVDLCPDEPEDMDDYVDEDGCVDPDNDRDTVPDSDDGCPDVAEDMDGFEDEDGCPEPDNDGDGVPDGQDACPIVPGPGSIDGCPGDAPAAVELGDEGRSRLTARGYGETRPVESSRAPQERAAGRRVEVFRTGVPR